MGYSGAVPVLVPLQKGCNIGRHQKDFLLELLVSPSKLQGTMRPGRIVIAMLKAGRPGEPLTDANRAKAKAEEIIGLKEGASFLGVVVAHLSLHAWAFTRLSLKVTE